MVLANNFQEINEWDKKAFRLMASDVVLASLMFMAALSVWLFQDRAIDHLFKIFFYIGLGTALLYGGNRAKIYLIYFALGNFFYDLWDAIPYADSISILQSIVINGIIVAFCLKSFTKQQMFPFVIVYTLALYLLPAVGLPFINRPYKDVKNPIPKRKSNLFKAVD